MNRGLKPDIAYYCYCLYFELLHIVQSGTPPLDRFGQALLTLQKSLFLSHCVQRWLSHPSIFGPNWTSAFCSPYHRCYISLFHSLPYLHAPVLVYLLRNFVFKETLHSINSSQSHRVNKKCCRPVEMLYFLQFYQWVCLPLCNFFSGPPLSLLCGSAAGLFLFCSLVTILFVVPRYSKCFW